MKPVVIMHISDLHFGMPEKAQKGHPIPNRKAVLKSFNTSFRKIPREWKPDILVVSGDIGWAGKEQDYQEAIAFFEEFFNIDGQKVTRENVVLCPGNHDVYHDEVQLGFWDRRRLQRDRPLNDPANSGVLALERGIVKQLNKHFMNYEDFCQKMGFAKLENSSDCYSYSYGSCLLKDMRFVVLNTEWDFLGKDDKTECKGRLRMGTDLLDDAHDHLAFHGDNESSPLIAVYHRPFDEWLHISERYTGNCNGHKSVKEKLMLHDISLTGHTHESDMAIGKYTHKFFSAGTIHSGESGVEFSCNLIKVYPEYATKNKTTPFSCELSYFQYKNPLPNSGNVNRSWRFVEPSQPAVSIFRIEPKQAEQVYEFHTLIEEYNTKVIDVSFEQLSAFTTGIGKRIRNLWSGFDEGLRGYFMSIDGMLDTFQKLSDEMHKQQKKAIETRASFGNFKEKELIRTLHDDSGSSHNIFPVGIDEGIKDVQSESIDVESNQINTGNVVRKEVV